MSQPPSPLSAEQLLAHAGFVRGVVRRLLGDDGAAEDVAQQTLLAALRQPPRNPATVRSWLARVARRFALRQLVREERRAHWERYAARDEVTESAADSVQQAELVRHVVDAALSLPEPYRTVLLQRYLEERFPREIARERAVPLETVKTQLRRGLTMLRQRIGLEDPAKRRALLPVLVPLAWPERPSLWLKPLTAGISLMMMHSKLGIVAALLVAAGVAARQWPTTEATSAKPGGLSAGQAQTAAANHAESPAPPKRNAALPPTPTEKPPDSEESTPAEVAILHGRVVQADGAPISGASIRLSSGDLRDLALLDVRLLREAPVLAESTSGADGSFAVPVPTPHRLDVLCTSPGFAATRLRDRATDRPLTITLEKGGVLFGQVHGPNQRPVPGARVALWDRNGPPRPVIVTHTDATGCYRTEPFLIAQAVIEVNAPGLAPAAFRLLDMQTANEKREDFELSPGRALRGVVSDASTGLPIPGARVSGSLASHQQQTTDGQGRFELAGLPVGAGISLHAEAEGYATKEHMLALEWDENEVLDLRLAPGRGIRGRVLNAQSEPLAGVYVAAASEEPAEDHGRADWCSTWTDSRGRFEILGAHRDLRHTLMLRQLGVTTALFDLPMRERDAETLDLGDIVLRPGATLSGSVKNSAGVGAEGVVVEAEFTASDRSLLAEGAIPLDIPALTARQVTTDAKGCFGFVDLPRGEVKLSAMFPGQPTTAEVHVTLIGGEQHEGIQLTLDAGPSIAGTVLGPDGAPLPMVAVMCRPSGESSGWLESAGGTGAGAASGVSCHFEVVGLHTGSYELRAFPPPYGSPVLQVAPLLPSRVHSTQAGTSDLVISLELGDSIEGTVLDARGEPVSQAAVFWLDRDGNRGAIPFRSNEEGHFTLVAPIGQRVTVVARGLAVAPGSKHPQPFTVEVEGVLSGSRDVVVSVGDDGESR